ncbi:MAG: hypothetical protein AVDCRST_MAG89-559, partial [uncultured Gemmatimonadetes bacterium]
GDDGRAGAADRDAHGTAAGQGDAGGADRHRLPGRPPSAPRRRQPEAPDRRRGWRHRRRRPRRRRRQAGRHVRPL